MSHRFTAIIGQLIAKLPKVFKRKIANGITTSSLNPTCISGSIFFSDLLRSETGKTTQEHIHYHLLEKAKTLLAGTEKSINEIAYELGFEYPQSFCKLFKKKVGSSPTEYRNGIFKN